MKFVLILTMFGIDGPDYSYVVDYGISGIDCIERLEEQQKILIQTFGYEDFALSCEMDQMFED